MMFKTERFPMMITKEMKEAINEAAVKYECSAAEIARLGVKHELERMETPGYMPWGKHDPR